MVDGENGESDLVETSEAAWAKIVPPDWRGQVGELGSAALRAFWAEALGYARWEIARYARWREQDEPVLVDGYDAEGVVQAAFERLMRREAGSVFYSAEDIRHELRSLIKHRVRWLHERSETRLMVGEWDVLPPRPDGELVSIFDYLPGRIEKPDEELMEKEKQKLLGEFKEQFEGALGKEKELVKEFRGVWDGQKPREAKQMQSAEGAVENGTGQVKKLRAQVRRRLAKYCAQAQGGMAEMLEGVKNGG